MNEDTIVALGSFCKELLSSPDFDALTKLYAQQCAFDILNTPPAKPEDRERIYASYQGFEGFLALVNDFATKATIKTPTPSSDDTTDIDDPRVHDIYDGTN